MKILRTTATVFSLPAFICRVIFFSHVCMMDTEYQNPSLANLFGLPYVLIRKPKPYDTTTLNYNWQIWDTHALSLYSGETECLDPAAAQDLYKTLTYLNQKEGTAIVMVTHDLKAALRSARTVLHIGRSSYFCGSVAEYLASPQGRRFQEVEE